MGRSHSLDHKEPLLSDLRLLKFREAVSSCLETDTPAGGPETLPLSKTGRREHGGHQELQHGIADVHQHAHHMQCAVIAIRTLQHSLEIIK